MKENFAKNDMTNGPIIKRLMYLALPIMGTQAMQMLYNLVDLFWLGRLGSEEVAATGAAGLYIWMSVAFMLLGSMGAGIFVSQAFGTGNEKRAKTHANTALFIALVSGIVFALVMIVFRQQMAGFFDFQEENVAHLAEVYLSVVAFSFPLTYISAALAAVFTASGNSRIPFYCSAVGISLNIILDPIFIFSLNLGVLGAAYVTIIGQSTSFILLVMFFLKSKARPFERIDFLRIPSLSNLTTMLKRTVPTGVESFLFTFLVMIAARREVTFGADAIAISRVGSQIESLTWLLGGAFGSALISFIGQNYGAQKWDRINRTYKIAFIMMFCYGAIVSLILIFPGKYIFGLFLPDPDLIERSVLFLRIIAICQIPLCIDAVASNAFRGLGRTMPPAIVNTTCNVLRVPLVYLLSADFVGLGLTGIWLAVAISASIKGIWSNIWYLLAERKRVKSLT